MQDEIISGKETSRRASSIGKARIEDWRFLVIEIPRRRAWRAKFMSRSLPVTIAAVMEPKPKGTEE